MNANTNRSIPNPREKRQSELSLAVALFRAQEAPIVSPVLANALWWHDRGVSVLPLPYGEKKPTYRWGQLAYTRLQRDHVIELFPPRTNLAAITGRVSGNLAVIDCDTNAAWRHFYQRCLDQGLPVLVTRTSRGGHFLFRLADGVLENATYGMTRDGEFQRDAARAALDVLGHDKLVVLPPSLNAAKGTWYTWHPAATEHATPPADDIPVWTLDDLAAILPGVQLAVDRAKPSSGKSYGQVALEDEAQRVASAQRGSRNTTLNDAAFAIGQLVAGGEINRIDAETVLAQAAIAAGLKPSEAHATTRSGLDAGERHPRRRPQDHVGYGMTREREALLAWCAIFDWVTLGRKAASVRAVAEAMAQRAGTATGSSWRASTRELAELARLSAKTVTGCLAELVHAGAVVRSGRDARSGAALWSLGVAAAAAAAKDRAADLPEFTTLTTLGSSSVVITGKNRGKNGERREHLYTDHHVPETSDAAERGAMGKTGWRVWRWLIAETAPRKTRDIAEALGLTYKQVDHALRRVQKLSPADYLLTERLKDGWIARPLSAWALQQYVAGHAEAQTAGRGEARQQLHEAERARRLFADILVHVRRWANSGYDMHIRAMIGTLLPAPDLVREGRDVADPDVSEAGTDGTSATDGTSLLGGKKPSRKPAARGAPQHAPDSDQLVRHKKRGAA